MRHRILVIGPTPPPYHGGSIFTNWVLTKLPQEEFSLIHLDTADRRGLHGIGRLDFTNIYLALRHGLQFGWLLLSQKPAVVYLQLSQALLPFLRDCLFLVPAILLRRKVVLHLHGSVFRSVYETWPRWARALARFTLGHVSRAIVLCERLKCTFAGLVPEDRIVTIPNGIDLWTTWPVDDRREHNPDSVFYIGALSVEKGVLDILRAVPEVMLICPHTRFVFAGEWFGAGSEEQARQLIERFDLGDHLIFCGPVAGEAKERLFREAAMLLLPSYHEGHPLVILEAMAASLPVIAADVGCIAETIGDGIGGFVIERGNSQQLAQKIVCLLQDDALRKQMGKAGRQRCLTEYSLESTMASLRNLFQEVLAER